MNFKVVNQGILGFTEDKEKRMRDFLTVKEVQEICQIKSGKAYKIMRDVNDEMQRKGYIVIRGRVNKHFLLEKLGIVGKKEMIN